MGKWLFDKEEREKWCKAALSEIFSRSSITELQPDDEIHFKISVGSMLDLNFELEFSNKNTIYDKMVDKFIKDSKSISELSFERFILFYQKKLNNYLEESIEKVFLSVFDRYYNGDILKDMLELREELGITMFERYFNNNEYPIDTVRNFILRKYYQEKI